MWILNCWLEYFFVELEVSCIGQGVEHSASTSVGVLAEWHYSCILLSNGILPVGLVQTIPGNINIIRSSPSLKY